jgi:peptidyl-prolyl cis-trans isomerase SurA
MNQILRLAALLLFVITANSSIMAQTGTLFSIGNQNISSADFLSVYKKNNMGKAPDMSESALSDYLQLYINFRLKVQEARDLRVDTIPNVKNELITYRSQLAKGYLTDKEKIDQLTLEAYNRMKSEVRVMHILVSCDPNASPADSMAAFQKINRLRNMIIKGKDFAKVAADSSDDKSAKDNGGDIGYISSLQVVYPFENAAYNTAVGKISPAFRTRFGYHIIKVLDVRPSRGTITVAHIFVKTSKTAADDEKQKAKNKIDDVYAKLQAGESFEQLARDYSEDKTTATDGGKLAPFSTGKMVPEFEDAAFGLNTPGSYTKPIQTKFGWHIIKLIEKKPLQTFDELKESLKKQVEKDQRADYAKLSFVANLKKEYNFTEHKDALNELLNAIDSNFVKGLWTAESVSKMNKPVITLTDNKWVPATKNILQSELATGLERSQRKNLAKDKETMFNNIYKQFVEAQLFFFEEERLSAKYPAFRDLMNEYNDGILLFELTDQKVWTKAVKDTIGLATFYQTVKQNYMSNEKAKVTSYTCANQQIADLVQASLAKGVTDAKILAKANKKNANNLKIDYTIVEKGKGSEIESMGWDTGKNYLLKPDNGGIRILRITEKLAPAPRPIEEVRGYVVADYQEKLEKEWVQSLREKYPVKVNYEELKSISK